MREYLERLNIITQEIAVLSDPFLVYRDDPQRGRVYMCEPEYDFEDTITNRTWRHVTMPMPPDDYNKPLFSGPTGHSLTWQHCLELTEAVYDIRARHLRPEHGLLYLEKVEKMLNALRPLDLYRESAAHVWEVYGPPVLTPDLQNFPRLAERHDLTITDDTLYGILSRYDVAQKIVKELRNDIDSRLRTSLRPPSFPHS